MTISEQIDELNISIRRFKNTVKRKAFKDFIRIKRIVFYLLKYKP